MDKIKGPVSKPAVKRRKVDLKTKVITDDALLNELKRQEKEVQEKEEKKKNKNKKGKGKTNNVKAKKQIDFERFLELDDDGDDDVVDDGDDDVVDDVVVDGDDDVVDDVLEDDIIEEVTDEEIVEEESDEDDEEVALKELWKTLSPPTKEEDIVQHWYGAIFSSKKKDYLYVGKAIRRYLDDENGPVSGIELDCLNPHVGSDTILELYRDRHDIDIFPAFNIISGPLIVETLRSNKWNVPKLDGLKILYEKYVKLDRKSIFNDLYK